jgi:hypothetical protein
MTEPRVGAVLPGISSLITTISGLLKEGVTVAQLAEKIAAFLAPGDVPTIQAIVKVLQEAEVLLGKV